MSNSAIIRTIITPTSTGIPSTKLDNEVRDEIVAPPVVNIAASAQQNNRVVAVKASAVKKNAVSASPVPAEIGTLGEESYVRTIASLSKTVETQKETLLRPGERISFERDLAVVYNAIDRIRKEVRKDPKNDLARQILYSSYQSKVDLMNSVTQKEELVASLR